MTFFIQYSRTKKSKSCCHPPFHPPIFCCHSLKLLSPTLPKLMNWIVLSLPPLSSDPDNPPKFGTCTNKQGLIPQRVKNQYLPKPIDTYYLCKGRNYMANTNNIPNIHGEFADNFPKNYFSRN